MSRFTICEFVRERYSSLMYSPRTSRIKLFHAQLFLCASELTSPLRSGVKRKTRCRKKEKKETFATTTIPWTSLCEKRPVYRKLCQGTLKSMKCTVMNSGIPITARNRATICKHITFFFVCTIEIAIRTLLLKIPGPPPQVIHRKIWGEKENFMCAVMVTGLRQNVVNHR